MAASIGSASSARRGDTCPAVDAIATPVAAVAVAAAVAAVATAAPKIASPACAFAAAPLDAAAHDAGADRVLLQLLPAQDFTPSDGRPMDVPAWRINAAIAAQLMDAMPAHQPLVIDYEHQTLHKEANGQPAPAAGWIHRLRWIGGRGLFAVAELTERARALIAAGEYRYFSPVFEYARPGGQVTRICMGALTNHPAISGMQALGDAQAAAALITAAATATAATNFPPVSKPPKESDMEDLLKKLRALLALPEDASAEQALAAIQALADAAPPPADDAPPQAAASAQHTIPGPGPGVDPARFVPIAVVQELQSRLAALTASVGAREVGDLIAPALADGRLLPVQEAWARELGQTNRAALAAFLQTAQPLAALTATQTQGQAPSQHGQHGQTYGLSAQELDVAAACGMTAQAYALGR